MDWLNEVLGRASALHRGKSARASRDCREDAARALRAGRTKEALALSSQAVLRAPLTGFFQLQTKYLHSWVYNNSAKSRSKNV